MPAATVRVHEVTGLDSGLAESSFRLQLSEGDGLVSVGDLVIFPELCTGAGEFEGVYFVGSPAPGDESGVFPLLFGEVEGVAVPSAMKAFVKARDLSVFAMYHKAFKYVIEEVHHCFLSDMFESEAEMAAEWEESVAEPMDQNSMNLGNATTISLARVKHCVKLEYQP